MTTTRDLDHAESGDILKAFTKKAAATSKLMIDKALESNDPVVMRDVLNRIKELHDLIALPDETGLLAFLPDEDSMKIVTMVPTSVDGDDTHLKFMLCVNGFLDSDEGDEILRMWVQDRESRGICAGCGKMHDLDDHSK